MQLATKINSLIRNDEILDAQDDRRYAKTNRGSDLPDEWRRRQVRLERNPDARRISAPAPRATPTEPT
ncbi:MAG: hypothetical protein EBZ29_02910, partial [Synechococcaceae bacterium WB9_4xC_028]|nr:hypothetical protein [Synechococcaceae bacterium WB9_4xC_028]